MPSLIGMNGSGEPEDMWLAQARREQEAPPQRDTSLHFFGLPQGFDPSYYNNGGEQPNPSNPFAAAANPQNWGLTLQDLESPLAYSSEPYRDAGSYEPRDTGGFFTLAQLFDFAPGGARTMPQGSADQNYMGTGESREGMFAPRAASPGGNVPPVFQMGSNAPSTNNWRLLGMGPGWVMRNGQLINTQTAQARQGLPANADPTFSDTGESGVANYARRVAPGAGLMGMNKYDAYFWPGGQIMGYNRWPYQTNV